MEAPNERGVKGLDREDDWHVGRFSLLCALLAKEHDVVARDRDGTVDTLLPRIDTADFDQLWLFAVDTGDGISADDCAAIGRFRERGGGIFVTRDHMSRPGSALSAGVVLSVCTAGVRGLSAARVLLQNVLVGNPGDDAQMSDWMKMNSV